MAAGFVALRDEDVGPRRDRLAGVGHRLDLAHNFRAGGLGFLGVGAGAAEGEGDDAGLRFDGGVEKRGEHWDEVGDEADAEGAPGLGADAVDFAADPVWIAAAVDAAEGAEGAGLRDGSGEAAARVHGHGGRHEWVVEAEYLGEAGGDHGHVAGVAPRSSYESLTMSGSTSSVGVAYARAFAAPGSVREVVAFRAPMWSSLRMTRRAVAMMTGVYLVGTQDESAR